MRTSCVAKHGATLLTKASYSATAKPVAGPIQRKRRFIAKAAARLAAKPDNRYKLFSFYANNNNNRRPFWLIG
jgi:hypothetical protein